MAIPAARTMAFSEIPVIDIGPLVAKGADNAPSVVEAIRKACTDVGFMQFVNHGVPRASLDRLFGQAQKFFNLPVEERMKTLSGQSWITGPGLELHAALLAGDVKTAAPELWLPQLPSLLAVGRQRLARGEHDDPFKLEPLYLRPSSAEEQWGKR